MSDSNVESTNSDNKKGEETSSSDNKPSLTSVTHKLKAEALRRFKIDSEIENEPEFSSDDPDANVDSNIERKEQDAIQADSNYSQLDEVGSGEEKDPQRNQESLGPSSSDTFRNVNVKVSSDVSVEQNVANLTPSSETQDNQNILANLEESEASKLHPNNTLLMPNNDMVAESINHHLVASSDTATMEEPPAANDDSTDTVEGFEVVKDVYESKCEEPISNEGDVVVNVQSSKEEPGATSDNSKTADGVLPSEITSTYESHKESDSNLPGVDETTSREGAQKIGFTVKSDDLSRSSDKGLPKPDSNGSSENGVLDNNAELPDQANLIYSSINGGSESNTTDVKAPDRGMQPSVQTVPDKNVDFPALMKNEYSSEINDLTVDNAIQFEHTAPNTLTTDVKSSENNVTSSHKQNGESINEKESLEQNVAIIDSTSNADFKGNIMEDDDPSGKMSTKHDEENASSMSAVHDDVETKIQIPQTESKCEEAMSNEGDVAVNVQSSKEEPGEDSKTADDVLPSEITHDPDQEDTEKPPTDEDEKAHLTDDFYYERPESLFNPLLTEGVPHDLLSLHHSFGYECTKRENLHILDANTVVFSAGNLVQILNLQTLEQTYIGGTNDGGIGAITVHPSRKYFAVAEKGVMPNINIYEYPSLKLFRVLREGTLEAYAHLNFSSNGTKLASLGSSPDFMLTAWDWKNEKVILRTKAFSQDVYKVAFSPENEGHLCTSGSGHIRFWTMASTFTGLKLQGELGRFGTTELTDIEGFVELPDGKVLSGSEWGNMLLWDGGLIKVEICKKDNKLCHNGMIEQFFMDEGELMTIGVDGFIKVWDFEAIDNADITDEKNRVFEMEPMYELKVGPDVNLKSMVKSVNLSTPTIWYGQDASGAIWKLDLSFTHTSHAPEKLHSFHAGRITGVDVSPTNHMVATCGLDCTVRLYDYVNKTPLCFAKYSRGATSLLWLPKSVDPKCSSILCGFSDGVVRLLSVARDESSTVRNRSNKSNLSFQMLQVFKPHTKNVTCIVIDKHGKMLATGSEDCSVFFFTIENKVCKPVAFIETASPVVSMSWLDNAEDPGGLLVFCKDGAVLDVDAPRVDVIDTTKTFKIPSQNLVKREYMFARIKDKLLKAEEDKRKAQIKAEKEKRKEEERKRRRARGIVEDEEQEEEDEEVEEEEEEEKIVEEPVDHGPCVVIRGFPSVHLDKFWMLMDGWDAGYIYECEFPKEMQSEDSLEGTEPINAIKLLECHDTPIRSFTYSHSGDFVLFGMENGVVRIHPVHGKNVLDSLTTYWALHAHDSQHGSITAIRTSFDDQYVFTVGADGNFFVYNFMSDATLKESKPIQQMGIPRIQTVIGEDGQEVPKTIDDIDDPNYYSIEIEKQKAEHDKMVKIAEEKKQNVRRGIAKLRRSFKSLLVQNKSLPEYLRIKAQELEIDPEIRKQQEIETAEKIDLVRKELAWESEKYSIGLRKLRDRFQSMMECDRIIVYACHSPYKVSSFRSAKLPELYEYLKQSLEEATKDGPSAANQKKFSIPGLKGMLPYAKRRSTQVDTRKKSQQPVTGIITTAPATASGGGGGQVGGKVAKALEKAEQRRIKRQLRQAEWDALYSSKPDDNYQDPKDVNAIKEAKDNIGDYKLKTADDYVVPEDQRVNAEIKLMQLLQLLDQIHYYKTNFNKRLVALRERKIKIIEEVKDCVNNLKFVQSKLDPSLHKPLPVIPQLKPDEIPERKMEFTKETLYAFKKKEDNKAEKRHDDGGGGGFGGFGVSESKPPVSTAGSRDRTFSNVSVLSGGRPRSSQSTKTDPHPTDTISEIVEESLSSLELQLQEREKIRMNYEQDRVLERVQFLLTNFDGEVKTLRHEKCQYEVTLKNADLKHVTLFEELVLLKEFEKREHTFATRVLTKEDEQEEMEDKVDDCQMKLEMKKDEIEKLQEREKSLLSTFSSMIGENNKFEGFLTRVFKKKIKRAKNKDESRAGSDDDSDESESDEEFSSSEESNSDEETLDDSVCPPGCDQTLFDNVCQLRESRLDIEESLAEEKKALETLKKELEALNKKSKVVGSALVAATSELEAFQREKQQKLNELDVVVTLKLHQIQYIVNNTMPQDLSTCLVFISSDQERLQKRIKELEQEKAEQKKLFRDNRQMHVQLKRDKKAREAEISELEEKVKNMQMLKFGRLVDLERLENVTVNRTAEELKERLRQQELQNANELAKWEKKIQTYKQKLTQRTRENTGRLNTSTLLYQEREELEQKLDGKQKSLGAEYSGNRKTDLRERHRLVQLVQLQAQEIDGLKDEITVLSRKGGHILPPSQPPLPLTAIPNI
ncbi:cilia- and flagella-associated protein 44-like [Dendronephthya gigantea]|uniref:cilia- and flagella-associated protein 44-like n=1 Tax=Dendronephthya gigantea TaxID=151771 RepID=UPI00106BAAF9|nr:cilia- and flagella-associated protein 44-like [Dendronephthya gigantea]